VKALVKEQAGPGFVLKNVPEPTIRDDEVLIHVRRAGVCGTDPFRLMPRFLDELAAAGFAGVQNFPTSAKMQCCTRTLWFTTVL